MRILFLDSETVDPGLKLYGSGWCFKYHYPEAEFEVLTIGYIDADGNEGCIDTTNGQGKEELIQLLGSHDVMVNHNAQYDMGVLRYLLRDDFDRICASPTGKLLVYDTMLFAKLVNQHLLSYGLDALTKHYKVINKQSDILHDYAWKSGLYQKYYAENHIAASGLGVNKRTRPSDAVLDKYCKTNMNAFPTKILNEYCLQDVRATKALFEVLYPKVKDYNLKRIVSDISKVCLDIKTHGIRVDLNKAKELGETWVAKAQKIKEDIVVGLNLDKKFNLDSNKQLGELIATIIPDVPLTEKGNYTIKAEWLDAQTHPLIKQISTYRKALKAEKDFARKIIAYQEAIPEKYREEGYGRIFPSLKPLGATLTGRFTSGGGTGSLELNMLAISRRNEEFGAPLREVFVADKDEKIVCCDFSNQEPRLQVHYAKALHCGGVDAIIKLWNENPTMKYHQKVADLTGLPYETAKMVTLGLAYNMRSNGLSQKLNISFEEAKSLIYQYYKMMPFMKQLQDITAKNLLKLGYIKTIDGRKLNIDPPFYWEGQLRTNESKAMSKLIQGSGAGQTIEAMCLAWEQGLKILLSVHDEILITTKQPEEDLLKLQYFMENAYKLCVPVVAEGGIGDNWGEAK